MLTPIAATAALLTAGLFTATATTATATAAAAATTATATATASTACAHVKIGATSTCLVAGRPCSPRYEKQYQSHGFKCRRNTADRYRLWKNPLTSLPPAV
ncbi:MAG TPA: hypothetical protein VG186_01865 [Solirubrobacteraceae bacterium]|nr:hypothetical protein [Solirubrobacteraceae bacterium]